MGAVLVGPHDPRVRRQDLERQAPDRARPAAEGCCCVLADDDALRWSTAATRDPFAVLGLHADADGALWLRALLPGAAAVEVLEPRPGGGRLASFEQRDEAGLFEAPDPAPATRRRFDYRLQRALGRTAATACYADAYAFGPLIDDADLHFLRRRHAPAPVPVLGAHPMHGRRRRRRALRGLGAERAARRGGRRLQRLGRPPPPDALRDGGRRLGDLRPARRRSATATSSSCSTREGHAAAAQGRPLRARRRAAPGHRQRRRAAAAGAPAAAGPRRSQRAPRADVDLRGARSARGGATPTARFLQLGRTGRRAAGLCRRPRLHPHRTAADQRAPVRRLLGLPDRSACTRRPRASATPDGFARFVDACHAQGLGVLLDWVPAHFPTDAHGLAQFDGTRAVRVRRPARRLPPRLEHADLQLRPPRGASNFLVGSALYWIERLRRRRPARRRGGLDALPRLLAQGRRVDAERARRAREPRGDRAAAANSTKSIGAECPGAITVAEESTAFPGVSARRPTPAAWASTTSGTWAGCTTRCEYIAEGPGAPALAPRQDDLRPGLRLQRELRAAAVARRGGARQGLAPRQHAGRRAGSASPTCAPTTASCGATRARSCCSWARSSRSGASGTTTRAAAGSCSTTRATPACSAWCAT